MTAGRPSPTPVPLGRSFYSRDSRTVAPELLNKLLVRGEVIGRIVEVEAYTGEDDPGSHAFRGETARNRTMFGRAGLLYVYFTYGMHWCANAVCGDEGRPTAVLLRAVAPVAGVEAMRQRRPAIRRDRDLTNGPAKLCMAFGIDRSADGADLVTGTGTGTGTRDGALGRLVIADDGTAPPATPGQSTRIGLSAGQEYPWRWYVPGDPYLSRPEPRAAPAPE
jgi:DNA-3-methyladenine glycosylase